MIKNKFKTVRVNFYLLVLILLLSIYGFLFSIIKSGDEPIFLRFGVISLITIIVVIYTSIKGFRRIKKGIEEKNRDKNSFLANISHELRTPLNGILGMNNLLGCTPLNEDQIEYVHAINNCGESLLNTINDILDYTKIDSEKLVISYINFDLRKLILDFFNNNRLSAELKNLEFNYWVDPEASNYLVGDPGRIRQILSNFMSNAVKFTANGSIDLTCKVISETEDDVSLEFSIKDTGIGIDSREIDHLFKEFSQSDSSASREFQGTGLGLAIAKRIVKLMDGDIGARSSMGSGSEFWFNLSFKRGESLLNPLERADINSSNFLIISKDSTYINNTAFLFKESSIKHRVTNSYTEAVSIISKENFDLVIFELPQVSIEREDLVAFLNNLKKSSIKSLSITNNGNKGDGELCRQLNINGYLVQPFNPSTLFEVVSMILGNDMYGKLITIHTLNENKRSKVKILLVDDNDVNLIVGKKLLEKMGFRTTVAKDGELAIGKIKEEEFHLVFMDIQMPNMNGLQASSLIREGVAGEHIKSVPIIALTANTTATDREHCTKVGMNEFLTKPYKPELLEQMINRFVKWDDL